MPMLSRWSICCFGLLLILMATDFSHAQNLSKTAVAKFQTRSTLTHFAAESLFEITVDAGKHDRENCIVEAYIPVKNYNKKTVNLKTDQGQVLLGQLSDHGMMVKATPDKKRLTFVIPSLSAGQTMKLTGVESSADVGPSYHWTDEQPKHSTLSKDEVPILRYMKAPLDESSPAARYRTMKIFHHVYTPDGSRLMTKGPGDGIFSKRKDGGLFSHHRGLFYGFNRISYEKDGKTMNADVWHCRKGESQSHDKTLQTAVGPVFGEHLNSILWKGQDGETFATELRQMTAFELNGSTLIEFQSTLESNVGPIKFRGDPQHAGFQFRASQDVAEITKKSTYYIRPDGAGKPGKFRNWSDKKDESEINRNHINLPWNTVVIELPVKDSDSTDQPSDSSEKLRKFSITYLDSPMNPKPARYSERDYARFGSYFEYDLKGEETLDLNYRVWIQEGVAQPETIENQSKNFTEPVGVTVH
ncbi:MAG: DUF6807 family protein [Planctomycetota bacterium]